jgi:hypothetical protein
MVQNYANMNKNGGNSDENVRFPIPKKTYYWLSDNSKLSSAIGSVLSLFHRTVSTQLGFNNWLSATVRNDSLGDSFRDQVVGYTA